MEAARELAGRLRIPRALADYRALLADPEIEAVVICSSTDTHAQIIAEAAQVRKHIFCEKPIAHDLSRIDEALDVVAAARVKPQIGFNRRFDPSFLPTPPSPYESLAGGVGNRRVREMVAEGKIGQPHILHITSRDPEPPSIAYERVSGGLFLDMTIHDFDMARYLLASEPVEIYAMGGVRVDPATSQSADGEPGRRVRSSMSVLGAIDTAVLTLRFENGAFATVDNSRKAVYGYDQRVEILGSGGMLQAANRIEDSHIYSDAEGVHSARPLRFFLERYAESFVAEMQAFVQSIHEGHEPPVTGRDGRIAVVMALAAERSLLEGRRMARQRPVLRRVSETYADHHRILELEGALEVQHPGGVGRQRGPLADRVHLEAQVGPPIPIGVNLLVNARRQPVQRRPVHLEEAFLALADERLERRLVHPCLVCPVVNGLRHLAAGVLGGDSQPADPDEGLGKEYERWQRGQHDKTAQRRCEIAQKGFQSRHDPNAPFRQFRPPMIHWGRRNWQTSPSQAEGTRACSL